MRLGGVALGINLALAFVGTRPHPSPMSFGEENRGAGQSMAREVEPLRPALTQYFRARIRDHSEADDLVQEVFARILARRADQPVSNLRGYVFQTAASVLADRARRRGVRHADAHFPFDPERHGDEELDPHRHASGKEDLRAAVEALMTLPERTRTIFILHRLEDRKYREVAVQLGISVSAVEKHMVRAIQHLAASLGGRA